MIKHRQRSQNVGYGILIREGEYLDTPVFLIRTASAQGIGFYFYWDGIEIGYFYRRLLNGRGIRVLDTSGTLMVDTYTCLDKLIPNSINHIHWQGTAFYLNGRSQGAPNYNGTSGTNDSASRFELKNSVIFSVYGCFQSSISRVVYNDGKGINLPLFSSRYNNYNYYLDFSPSLYNDGFNAKKNIFVSGITQTAYSTKANYLSKPFTKKDYDNIIDFLAYRVGKYIRRPQAIQEVSTLLKDYIFEKCRSVLNGLSKTGQLAQYNGSTDLPDTLDSTLDIQSNRMSGLSKITRSKLLAFYMGTQTPLNLGTNYANNTGGWAPNFGADGSKVFLHSAASPGGQTSKNIILTQGFGATCSYSYSSFTIRSVVVLLEIIDSNNNVLTSVILTGGLNSTATITGTIYFIVPSNGEITLRLSHSSTLPGGTGGSVALSSDTFSFFNAIEWSGQQNPMSIFSAYNAKIARLNFIDPITLSTLDIYQNNLGKFSETFKAGCFFTTVNAYTNNIAENDFTFPENIPVLYLSSNAINSGSGQVNSASSANISFENFTGVGSATPMIHASSCKLSGKLTLPKSGAWSQLNFSNNLLNCHLSEIFDEWNPAFSVTSYLALSRNQLYGDNYTFPAINCAQLMLSDPQSTSGYSGQTGAGTILNLNFSNVLNLVLLYLNNTTKLDGTLTLPIEQKMTVLEVTDCGAGLTLIDNIPPTLGRIHASNNGLTGDISTLYLNKSNVWTAVRLYVNQLTGAIKAAWNDACTVLWLSNNKLTGQAAGEVINHVITASKFQFFYMDTQSGAGNSTFDLSGQTSFMYRVQLNNTRATSIKLSDTVSNVCEFYCYGNPELTTLNFGSVIFISAMVGQIGFYGGSTVVSSVFNASGCALNMVFPIGDIIRSRDIQIQNNGMSTANVDATIDNMIANAVNLVSGSSVNMGGTNGPISEAKIPALLDFVEASGVAVTVNTPSSRAYGKLMRIARILDGQAVTAANQIWVEASYNAWTGQLNQTFTILGTANFDGVYSFSGVVQGGTFKARLNWTGEAKDFSVFPQETGVFYKN